MVEVLAPRCADPRGGDALAAKFSRDAAMQRKARDAFAARSRKLDVPKRSPATGSSVRSRSVLERRVAAAREALAKSKADVKSATFADAAPRTPPPAPPPTPTTPRAPPTPPTPPARAVAPVAYEPPPPPDPEPHFAAKLFKPGSPTSTPRGAAETPPRARGKKPAVSFELAEDDPRGRREEDESEEDALERCASLTRESKLRQTSSRMLIEKDRQIADNYNDLMSEPTAAFQRDHPSGDAASPPWFVACFSSLPFSSHCTQGSS
jgi:hypothetical protein